MNHVTHPLSSADINIFLPEISKFCYIKKYRYRFYLDTSFLILLTFLETLRIALINMVTILSKNGYSLLKIKIFWKKRYDIIIYHHDVINKKFGNSSISVRDVITSSML